MMCRMHYVLYTTLFDCLNNLRQGQLQGMQEGKVNCVTQGFLLHFYTSTSMLLYL